MCSLTGDTFFIVRVLLCIADGHMGDCCYSYDVEYARQDEEYARHGYGKDLESNEVVAEVVDQLDEDLKRVSHVFKQSKASVAFAKTNKFTEADLSKLNYMKLKLSKLHTVSNGFTSEQVNATSGKAELQAMCKGWAPHANTNMVV